jgi:hypothetical protein
MLDGFDREGRSLLHTIIPYNLITYSPTRSQKPTPLRERNPISLSMPPPTHLRLPVHIRLRLPIQRLRIARGLERILGRLLRHIHLRQAVRGRRFCQQLHLTAPLHQRVQVAGLVDRPADGQQPVVAQDEPFAFGPQRGG